MPAALILQHSEERSAVGFLSRSEQSLVALPVYRIAPRVNSGVAGTDGEGTVVTACQCQPSNITWKSISSSAWSRSSALASLKYFAKPWSPAHVHQTSRSALNHIEVVEEADACSWHRSRVCRGTCQLYAAAVYHGSAPTLSRAKNAQREW